MIPSGLRGEGDKRVYRIYIVEDDRVIADAIRDSLNAWGFEARNTEDFSAVTKEFAAWQPQLVLLDIALPFFNGYHWCQEIRKLSSVPIVFLSSSGDNMNIVMAMNLGADDFIAKPFDLTVLMAKVQAMLRRAYDYQGQSHLMEHRGLLFDSLKCTVTANGKQAELTKNENRILQSLLENKCQVVPRDTLIAALWECDSFVDENTLNVNITRLRRKLDSIGLTDFIATKKGLGYQVK